MNVGKVKQEDVLLFSRQLATLVRARIPLEQCLEVLVNQIPNPLLQNIIRQIRADVISGTPLSAALGKYPDVFDTLYVGMVRAGEASGKLPEILVRTAKYLERTSRIKNKVKAAMIYPALVISVGFLVVGFIMVYVIPQFESMFRSMKGDLPGITKMMIFISRNVVKEYFLTFPNAIFVLLGVSLLIYFASSVLKSEKGRYNFDKFLLTIPIFGEYIQKVVFAKFSQTLGILIGNGVPILESMELVSKTVGNKPIEASILDSRERIKEGEKIADTLRKNVFFPPLVVQLIHVGEQTGKLGEVLEQISDYYDEEVEISTAALVAVIEPLLIIILAGIVGVIVVSLYLPIFRMYSQQKR
jgi:type IV pilus assembly protein PilC